jgi:hypothetical protein
MTDDIFTFRETDIWARDERPCAARMPQSNLQERIHGVFFVAGAEFRGPKRHDNVIRR